MPKSYIKSLKEYDGVSVIDEKKLLEALKKTSGGPRKPTSVALEEATIKDLKKMASKLDVPYQVLMRMFILDGLRKIKQAG